MWAMIKKIKFKKFKHIYVTLQRIKCAAPHIAGAVTLLTAVSVRRAMSGVEL
jgi:hypothetical protein